MLAKVVQLQQVYFTGQDVVCTRTLYNYVDKGLIGIKNADLPEKLKRNTKRKRVRLNKKKLGHSIDERPKEIDKKRQFHHSKWYCLFKIDLNVYRFRLSTQHSDWFE